MTVSSEQTVSACVPDWARERADGQGWSPGRRLLAAIRAYQGARGPFAWIIRRVAVLRHRFWSAVAGCDIPINVSVGGGLLLPHPNGIVIHPGSRIGPNCLLFQQVTIGDADGVPTIGGHVDIGAGARVLGPVVIGDHARIGANAVVLSDVPAGATAVGIPARILKHRGDA
jgi:serine O-acetyltransferase